MIVALTVIVAVAASLIVAVHVNVNATVGVIERFQKVAQDGDRLFLLGIQQDFASIAAQAHRFNPSITPTVAFPFTCTAHDHGCDHGHDHDHAL